MELVIVGAGGAHVCDWASYALLRDNVQHFIEAGAPSDRFRALHEIERAVDEGSFRVDAARLRGEVMRARCALAQVDLARAAISLRTRAVLTGCVSRPLCRGTLPARSAGWELPLDAPEATLVPQAAARFIDLVLALTGRAVDGDQLEIRCREVRARRPLPHPVAAAKGSARRGAVPPRLPRRLPPPLPPTRREPELDGAS
jgi:hypothetical protein